MRNCACVISIIAAAFLFVAFSAADVSASPAVTLTVLNPRGEIAPVPVLTPQPRLSDLSGKKIGIYWNGKSGGNLFWNIVEQLLKQKLPTATVIRYEGAYDIGDALAAKMAKEVDTFLYGVGD
jgi:hypothetical protein